MENHQVTEFFLLKMMRYFLLEEFSLAEIFM